MSEWITVSKKSKKGSKKNTFMTCMYCELSTFHSCNGRMFNCCNKCFLCHNCNEKIITRKDNEDEEYDYTTNCGEEI